MRLGTIIAATIFVVIMATALFIYFQGVLTGPELLLVEILILLTGLCAGSAIEGGEEKWER